MGVVFSMRCPNFTAVSTLAQNKILTISHDQIPGMTSHSINGIKSVVFKAATEAV